MFSFFKSLRKRSDKLSFWEHVDIMRVYLIISILAILVCAIVAFFFKSFIFDVIILGPKDNDFITYRALCRLGSLLNMDSLCIRDFTIDFINIELGGQFRYHLLISVVSGIICAAPIISWQLWLFIKPALYDKELKYGRRMVFFITGLFLVGVFFGYFIIVPLSVNFLATYELSVHLHNQIAIGSYISTVSVLTLSMGLVFELPVLAYFLTKIDLLSVKFLRKYRKHALILIFIVAGFITPSTDFFSQALVSLPLWILYEASILICKKVAKGREQNA